MIQDGIEALCARAKRIGNVELDVDPASHLRDELLSLQRKLAALQNISPDDDHTNNSGSDVVDLETRKTTLEDILIENGKSPAMCRGFAFKRLLLTRLPSILCIHVQRRFYDPETSRMSKTLQHIIFPEYLNVAPYCAYGGLLGPDAPWAGTPASSGAMQSNRPILYRLQAVIEHRGGAFYGHYVSYRRDPATKQWLFISDDTVKRVDWQVVQNCQAYMLFYEAR